MFHVEHRNLPEDPLDVPMFHVEHPAIFQTTWSVTHRGKRLDPRGIRVKDVPDDRQLSRYCIERSGGRRAGGASLT
jgi:hypothetical protein